MPHTAQDLARLLARAKHAVVLTGAGISITQNIDGLHVRAGSTDVIEVHGSLGSGRCLRCDVRPLVDELLRRADAADDGVPRCDCGFQLKSDVVLFGEMLPGEQIDAAFEQAGLADVMLVIGSSLLVAPVSNLPGYVLANRGDLAVLTDRPVVVTGSMRHSREPSWDGPFNVCGGVPCGDAPVLGRPRRARGVRRGHLRRADGDQDPHHRARGVRRLPGADRPTRWEGTPSLRYFARPEQRYPLDPPDATPRWRS